MCVLFHACFLTLICNVFMMGLHDASVVIHNPVIGTSTYQAKCTLQFVVVLAILCTYTV